MLPGEKWTAHFGIRAAGIWRVYLKQVSGENALGYGFVAPLRNSYKLRLLPSFVLFRARYLFRPRWSRVSQVFAFKTILNLLTDRDDFSRNGRETKSKCNTIAKVQHTCHRIYFSFNYVANFYEYRVIIRTADIYADLCFCKYNSRNETWTENYSICCVLQKLLHLQYFKIVCILYCQIFYV